MQPLLQDSMNQHRRRKLLSLESLLGHFRIMLTNISGLEEMNHLILDIYKTPLQVSANRQPMFILALVEIKQRDLSQEIMEETYFKLVITLDQVAMNLN